MAPTPPPDTAAGATTTPSPDQVLQEVFGYGAFRGGSALVLMPTGGGKSLCYQIPALCRSGVGVVVSPLIALMQDQVEGLRQAGVRAAALNSSLEASEASSVWRALEQGELDLLYASPERLLSPGFLERLAAVSANPLKEISDKLTTFPLMHLRSKNATTPYIHHHIQIVKLTLYWPG
jgi:superfamily II DNA helicase RecQ